MHKTLSVVSLGAIEDNARKIKSLLGGKKFFAVVKADAYGHGAAEVARRLEPLVDGFCVAIIDEGVELRVAGISKPVLVFAPPLEKYDVARAMAYDLTVTVNGEETARLACNCPCHIKVNTGMNRLGCNISELEAVLSQLRAENVQGVYSHLFAAENARASLNQLELFERAEKIVKSVNPDICAHLAASGGLLRGGKFIKDGVRCGILLYGYAPAGFKAEGFKRALKVYARRTQITKFIGGGVGYNFAERQYGELSAYRLGYADGFLRGVPLGEKTLCMDAFLKVGGGEMECVMDDAESYAKRCKTISYEVLTSVTRRSEIVYER